jgi:integrase
MQDKPKREPVHKLLTERFLRSLKPEPPGERRFAAWDTIVPGGAVRVSDKEARHYLVGRIAGREHPTAIPFGVAWPLPFPSGYPLPNSLAKIRNDQREALSDMVTGVDPREKRKAAARARVQEARSTFAAVAADYLLDHAAELRSRRDIEGAFKNHLLPAFGKRSITEISEQDCARLIKSIAKKHPTLAHHVRAYLSGFFSWALAQHVYGLTISPMVNLSGKALVGKLEPRTHVPTDNEQAAIWTAASALPYPDGPYVRLLQLLGQRRNEIADATWSEFDLDKGLWVIPSTRMKGGVQHIIPLAPRALEILKSLPRLAGPFVFSSGDGTRPISDFSRMKERVDAALPEDVAAWRFHDLRRAMRTGLSRLGIVDLVSELLIAHTRPELHRIYDQYVYPEKRQALEKWERHLASICESAPANVVELSAARK